MSWAQQIRAPFFAAIFGLLFAQPGARETRAHEAIGILLQTGPDAKLIQGRTLESRRKAFNGDLIYEGYKLFTGGQPVRYLHLPTRRIYTYSPRYVAFPVARSYAVVERPDDDFEVRFSASGPLLKRVQIIDEVPWGEPLTLPGFRTAVSAADRDRILRLVQQSQLGDAFRTALFHLTAAEVLERESDLDRAQASYKVVQSIWSEAPWVRRRMLELEREIRAQRVRIASARQRNWGVLIGVTEHRSVEALAGADRDAALFRAWLTDVKGGGLQPSNVVVLQNNAASTAAIRNGLEEVLMRRAAADDTVYVFLSCYGFYQQSPEPARAWLIASDSAVEEKQATAYALAELSELVRAASKRVKRILLFADLAELPPSSFEAAPGFLAERLVPPAGAFHGIISTRVRRSGPPAASNAFSRSLVAGLQGAADANHDGRVSLDELYRYVSAAVTSEGREYRHVVQIGTPSTTPVQVAAREEGFRIALGGRRRFDLALLQVAAAGLPPLADEEFGQSIIHTYLRGHQVPQRQEAFAQAEAAFARANQAHPSPWLEARQLFCQGRRLIFERRHDEATAVLERAIGIEPDAAYTYNALGIAYLETGRLSEAAHAFRDAIRLAPSWIYPMHNLALTYTDAGAWDAAIRQYRAALKVQPGYGTLHQNLAAVYHQLGRYRDAEAEYHLALKDPVAGSRGFIGIGILRAAAGRHAAAETAYMEAMKQGVSPAEVLHNLGVLYLEWGRTDQAVETLERAVKTDARSVPARLELARAYNRAGRFDDAAREFNAAGGGHPGRGLSMLIAENEGDHLFSKRSPQAAEKYADALNLAGTEEDRERIRKKRQRTARN